jgi:hypothetical protein
MPLKLFGGSLCQKLLGPKKIGKKKLFPVVFPSNFFIALLAVSLHEEPKNTIKIFSKIRPENLQKSPKKVPWYLPRFFVFFGAPCAGTGTGTLQNGNQCPVWGGGVVCVGGGAEAAVGAARTVSRAVR